MKYPQSLAPELVADKAKYNNLVPLLKSLSNRGIVLNTWQVSELIDPGSRGVGKTTLAFVIIAEEHTAINITIAECKNYDQDIRTIDDRFFLRGLKDFLEEYYNDKFNNIRIDATGSRLIADSIK